MLAWLEQTTGSQKGGFWKGGCKLDHRGCVIPWAAVTTYHRPSSSENRNFSCHSSGGQKSKMKVLEGLVTSEGHERESIPCLWLRFWWFVGNLLYSSACLQTQHPDPLCLHVHMAFSQCVPVFAQISTFIGTYSIRGPIYSRMPSFQIITFTMILFPGKVTF